MNPLATDLDGDVADIAPPIHVRRERVPAWLHDTPKPRSRRFPHRAGAPVRDLLPSMGTAGVEGAGR